MSAPEYAIASLRDFLKVPKDRRRACLDEFWDFLEIADSMQEAHTLMMNLLPEMKAMHEVDVMASFVWVDDGKKNRTLRIELMHDDVRAGNVEGSGQKPGKEAA